MSKSQAHKNMLKQGLIALGILIGVYVFFLSPFLKEGRSLMDEELEKKTAEIKRYITRTGSMPSKESFEKLDKESSELEKKFLELMDFVDPEKPRMSESGSEAGLYFIERLHTTMKKFEDIIGVKAIRLPGNLGFGDGLPKESMVEVLLRQLETVEFMVGLLLKSERIEISNLKPLKAIEYIEPVTKKLFYTELPVQVSVKTDNKTIANLLLELKNRSPIVSVKELHMKGISSGDIEVTCVVSTFMVARENK